MVWPLILPDEGDHLNSQDERGPFLELLEREKNRLTKIDATKVQLRREIGLFSAVNLIIGCMIGSGIFISPAITLEKSGSIGLCLIIWFSCGVISLLGALAAVELATLVPKSGGTYSYFIEAFKSLHPFWGPLPSFLYVWIAVLILSPAGSSVVCLTFAEYFCQPFFDLNGQLSKEEMDWLKKLIAICALGLTVIINMLSVKLYVKLQNVFTISKLTVCAIIIIGGIYVLSTEGKTKNFKNPFENSTTAPNNIILALYSGLWAYIGWNSVTVITEELKTPEKNIPRSIGIAIPTVTAIYLLMNIAYMTVLTVPEMVEAPAVAVEFGKKILGPLSFIIPLGVALSAFGATLSAVFSNARLCFAAAREGHMIEVLSYIHVNRLTPAPAIATQGLIMLIFILVGNITDLINFISFLSWIFTALAMAALILMRFTKRDQYRPYKVSIIVPIITMLISIFLSMIPIVMNPTLEYLFAVGLLVLGFLLYVVLIYYKKTPQKLMNKLTQSIQIIFNVVPPGNESDLSAEK